jgi:hypothetical protein
MKCLPEMIPVPQRLPRHDIMGVGGGGAMCTYSRDEEVRNGSLAARVTSVTPVPCVTATAALRRINNLTVRRDEESVLSPTTHKAGGEGGGIPIFGPDSYDHRQSMPSTWLEQTSPSSPEVIFLLPPLPHVPVAPRVSLCPRHVPSL